MTNTSPNMFSYLYDGHSWTEYASYFVIIFKYILENNFDARPIPSAYTRDLIGNWPCIEILLRNIFENNDKIRRIFSPRVNVIEIRKRVRACIRRRGDHFEQNLAN
ncbi:hypothetical protein SFRURICE_007615 [Spodoptera frugiperda]|nr:hypothetical protein SFRURICE_007615 [Spodoptera frugiperda]